MNGQRHAQRLQLRLLGPLEAAREGQAVALGPPKQRALLAHLVLHADEAVPVERLVDQLWPESPPESARHAIHVYVSRLRTALGDSGRIVARSRAYTLQLEPGELDLGRFRSLVGEARVHLDDEPADAAAQLREALSLWRGRALADLDGEPGVRDLVLELEEERLEAIELRIEAELATGRAAELVPELERLLAEHPAREKLYGQLMLALYRSGRQADALAVYTRARETLLAELGLEPGPALRGLQAAILRQDPSLMLEPPEYRARRHLPAQANPFIGRKRELEELVELVASGGVRLVTLTGPGGVGKTRLAIAAAERLAGSFRDGVWFIDLAPIADAEAVAATIAEALGVTEQQEQSLIESLAEYARDRELLLLVDNLEHVLHAATALSQLLRAAPGLKIVATSRVPLNLYGEHLYAVPTLSLPTAGDREPAALERVDAVALLVARARASCRDFALTEANAPMVTRLSSALDGLPLAIELAAARLRTHTMAEVIDGLADRLNLLAEGPRDVEPRHRTLRAAIGWTWELLTPEERRLFAHLSVFAGGFDAAAVEAVAKTEPALIVALERHHLVQRLAEDRWSMLATIRAFAREQLDASGDAPTARRSHALYYAALAEEADEHLRGPEQVSALERLDTERSNLIGALDWAYEADEAELLLRLAGGLGRYWQLRGSVREGTEWIDRALNAGNREERAATPPMGRALNAAAWLHASSGRITEVRPYAQAALEVWRSLGDLSEVAGSLSDVSRAEMDVGNVAAARACMEEARAVAETLGDPYVEALTVGNLGALELEVGDYDRARALSLEAAEAARKGGIPELVAFFLANAGHASVGAGDLEAAYAHLVEALRLATDLRVPESACFALRLLAVAALEAERWELGLTLLGSVAESEREAGLAPAGSEARFTERGLAMAEAAIGPVECERFLSLGRVMPFEVAVEEALAFGGNALNGVPHDSSIN